MANQYGHLDDVTIYVPSAGEFVHISEGSGDNLSQEDMDNGYVDYVYYDTLTLHWGDTLQEYNGGMKLLERDFCEEYPDTEDGKAKLIADILDLEYYNSELEYIEIQNNN